MKIRKSQGFLRACVKGEKNFITCSHKSPQTEERGREILFLKVCRMHAKNILFIQSHLILTKVIGGREAVL